MKYTAESQNQFVVDLLTSLRKEKFSPRGWWHFIVHSWEMSWHTAQAHPTLKHSWVRITLFISTLVLAMLIVDLFIEGPGLTAHLLPGFFFCVVWQQSDLFWHLGLNRQVKTGELLPKVGIANTLTWLRALGASYLLGRLIGGVSTPSWLVLLVFLSGVVTDVLDGQVAHFTQTQSKLGQIGDGETDFCLYTAIAIVLMQNGVLPFWLGMVMLLRFLGPLFAVVGSYFLFARPIRFGSTVWGKYAGLAQCIYFLALLAPRQLEFITRFIDVPLLIVTLVLLFVAPVAQLTEHLRSHALVNRTGLRGRP